MVLDNSFQNDPDFVSATGTAAKARNILDPLRIVQLLSLGKSIISQPTNKGNVLEDKAFRRGELGLDDQIYFEKPDPEWNEAWKITEALLAQISKEVGGRH